MIPFFYHHAVALLPLTCVASLANYREGEGAWKIVRKSVCRLSVERQVLTYSQVVGHDEDEDDHMCSALVHMCGEVWIHLPLWSSFFQ